MKTLGQNVRNSETPDVFISHASEDVDTANRLRTHLEDDGVQCWIAPRDVIPGEEYAAAIIEALKQSQAFVLVFSENSERSPHVRCEIERAASLDLPIIVFRIDSTQLSASTDFFLRKRQWLDTTGLDGKRQAARLTQAVRRILSAQAPRDEPTDASPPAKGVHDSERQRTGISDSGTRRVVGIDLGSTNIRGCVVELMANDPPKVCRDNYIVDIKQPATGRSVLEQVKGLLSQIYEQEHLIRRPPIGIGIAAAGQVDVRAGTLKFGPGLGVRNVPLRNAIASAHPRVEVRVDNDARCATRCELYLGA